MLEVLLPALGLLLPGGYFLWRRKTSSDSRKSPSEASDTAPTSPTSLLKMEDWPWPMAVVDERRRLLAVTPALKAFFPAPDPQNLLELPFPGLVEFHEKVFREGQSEVEFEWRGRWWRLLGRRIDPERAALFLVEITREVKLVEKNRLLSATLAHEFRTPLTAIKGYAEALEEYLPEEEFPRKALSAILTHTERLARLVRDLLLLSSLESGLKLRPEPVTAGDLVETAVHLLVPLIEEKKLQLEISGFREARLCADRDYLIQALLKVLENAVRFSPEGGRIRIEIAREGTEILFRIRDEGPGIPEELRERIFEPFFREGPGKGLGLGLALARRLAEAHGGTLFAETSRSGASLVFRLPANVSGTSQKVHNKGGE